VRDQGAHGLPGEAVEGVFLEYGMHGVLGRGRLLLGERRLWLWLWFRLIRSRVYGKTVEAGFARLKLRGWLGRGRERFRSGARPGWRRIQASLGA
jgi:hypothetical protein